MIKPTNNLSETAEQNMTDREQDHAICGGQPGLPSAEGRRRAGTTDEPLGPNYFMAGGPYRSDMHGDPAQRR